MDELLGNSFLRKCTNDKDKDASAHEPCDITELTESPPKLFALYFAAYWCPASRNFTRILNEFYNQRNMDAKEFEVIFVSMDRSEEQFEQGYAEMPWMALNFGDERLKTLRTRFEVKSIPYLVVFDPETCRTVSIRGRKDVQDLDAWPLWLTRRDAGEFCYEVPNHPISHTTTEEAKEGQIKYDEFMEQKRKEMEEKKKIAEERQRMMEEKAAKKAKKAEAA
jgi:thiol-disulfide isomerase/thioredoxin